MQVSVESTGQLERRLTITVDDDKINEAVEARLKNISRTAKIKGFRAGKVPMQMVKQHYGPQVRQEVLGDVMQSSFYEAITKENLRPAGYPNFEPKSANPGEGFQYIATFEIYPELTSIKSNLTIEKPTAVISEADVDTMIGTIRKQHHTWEVVARAALAGDRAVIDFDGQVDGKSIAGGQGKGYPIEIGSGRMIKGFEDGLIGMSAGEEKDLNLAFPENYHAKELAGKPAQFHVKMQRVEESMPPPNDSELAKRLGVDDGDTEKMRAEIRANMQRELDGNLTNKVKQIVMDEILKLNPIEIPKALIDGEAQHLAEQMANNLIRQGMPKEQVQLQPSIFNEQAKRRVALGLILAEVIKQQKIDASAERVRQKIDAIAAPYERPQEVVSWYYADKRRLSEIESLVLEEQVVEWILGQAKVTEKSMSFNDVMNPQK